MTRKRVTERFPWLLPIRQAQRKIFFYVGMRLDKNTYAQTQKKHTCPMRYSKLIHKCSTKTAVLI